MVGAGDLLDPADRIGSHARGGASGQVHKDTGRRAGEDQAVDAIVARDGVIAEAAQKRVIAASAAERVIAIAAIQVVIIGAA